jgi:hypothetical protein
MPVLWVLVFACVLSLPSCTTLPRQGGGHGYSGSRQLDEWSLREGYYRR